MAYLKAVSTAYYVITSVRVVVKDSELERFRRKLFGLILRQFAWTDQKIISVSIDSLGADI
jgi:hypothetical protein